MVRTTHHVIAPDLPPMPEVDGDRPERSQRSRFVRPCRWTWLVVSAALVVLPLIGACSDEGSPEAQPNDSAGFSAGGFDDLPKPPRSDPVGERTEKDDVVSQSFEVRNLSPRQVLDFYADNLDGWSSTGIEQTGSGTYRGTWTRQGRELTVSATPAPTLSDGQEQASQYSLSLRAG